MTTQLRKPSKVSLLYHKSQKLWYWRYTFGKSQKVVDESTGKVKYKANKEDVYITDFEWYPEPNNGRERQANKETEQELELLLKKKQVEIKEGKYSLLAKSVNDRNVLDDFVDYYENKGYKDKTRKQHETILYHLKIYTNVSYLTYSDLTEEFMVGFLDYLKEEGTARKGKALADTSVSNYFNKFKVFLGQMVDRGYLKNHPAQKVVAKKGKAKRKTSLTAEELQSLINTENDNPALRKFFLFSCFSGQAMAECLAMEWRDIEESNGTYTLLGTRIKTNSDYRIALDPSAVKLLGVRRNDHDKVFRGLKYSANNNLQLLQWCKDAGISKHVTPHVGRSTFARLWWENPANNKDILVLMQILDHKDVSTTQRYLASLIGSANTMPTPSIGEFDI